METFQGKITEFVDWTSGVNSLTGNIVPGVDANHPISGKSIRELIQDKLKTPFVTYKDDTAGYIRFFSSNDAKEVWESYAKSESATYNPELAEDYVLYNMDLPATYKITGLDSFITARYIIEGNSNSSNAVLSYTMGLEDSLGDPDSDVITVTYTVKDSSDNTTYNESYQIDTGKSVTKGIYQYLRSGENKVTIKASANNHNAQTTRTFSIYLVTFSISSNFAGYYTGVSNGRPFAFDVAIQRSITNLPIDTYVYISEDGTINQTPVYTWRYTESGSTPSKRIEIQNDYLASDYDHPRKYRMVIKSQMNDAESQSSFNSNVLVYEFEVSSNLGDLSNAFVNCACSIADSNYAYVNSGKPILHATQYVPFTFDWGYFTDAGEQQSNVDWYLRTGTPGNYEYTDLVGVLGIKGSKPNSLSFIPNTALSFYDDHSYLVAKIEDEIVEEFPITVSENIINVVETGNYALKLTAYGKTNSSDTKDQWVDSENNVTTTFSSGVQFDNTNGWDNNSLVLKGSNSYATINYIPFPETLQGQAYNISNDGAAFEIDFKPEQVNDDDDIILTIGDTTKGYIAIRPTSAAFYEGSATPTIKTNFKAGERIKLCFVFNRYSEISNDSNLIYIINNGILERAAIKGNAAINSQSGRIKIGGSGSGIRVYSIRCYRTDITPKQALENYMFDNISNSSLISRNDIYGNSSTITYQGMQGKQDIIIIEGNLYNILNNAQSKENATVNITRESNTDASKNFQITGCRIRNHGQSTLSYPITSMKMWFNKSNSFYEDQNGVMQERIPELVCTAQQYLNLNKNRYIMKSGAIPSNKFVLQANYADSSGAHNGSLLRLIQDTWYNAQIGENNEFKLRTAPQLFTSGAKITHNNPDLNEAGTWIEGLYNIPSNQNGYDSNKVGLTWPEITGVAFPYTIRTAADSFPCTVFYRDTSTQEQNLTLLGQYVFMDDKKSDFVYGERSIYYTDDPTDPFCMKIENKKKDDKENKVWDNKNVLQIEVVYPNSPLTSYSSKSIASSYELDENDNLIASGTQHRFDDPYTTDQQGNVTSYYWEQHFELIYPDKEDITDKNGNFSSSDFTQIVTPFMNFLEWITDVAALKNTGAVLGQTGSQARVTQAELNKFIAEAHDHLDLYKLAAYYIFFLRFGLIDSVERNAQLKTYDGQHFHYEPWDMDIALGCANNGVIAYDPPLTRDTLAGGSTYAFSGRTATQSNVLWDCLECWDYWANILVPEVAQALYEAGLTYENASRMFDDEYVGKWSETLYNESGHYKYIDATLNPKYRLYLNGARTSHRHWWLSKSMNYYDAKWSCGDFTKHSIQFRISKPASTAGYNLMKIYPTNNTFFKAQYGSKGDEIVSTLGNGLTEATVEVGGEAIIDADIQLEDKQPCFIFGASSIEGLDLSGLLTSQNNVLGRGYTDISFADSYDDVLGASLKTLKLGAPCTPNLYTNPNETQYVSNLSIGQNGIDGMTSTGKDALENLELLDVVGWYNKQTNQGVSGWISGLFSGTGYDRKNINKLYAMGCDMATEFKTSNAGNKFVDLRLPASVTTLEFVNSSWEDISFWETTVITSTRSQYDKIQGIPASVNSVSFKGSTAKNECSLDFVLSWIDNIEAEIATAHPDYTENELEAALWQALSQKVIYAEQINWGTGTTKLYYKDVIRLSKFGNDGILYNLKGYVVISDSDELTSMQLTELQNAFGSYVFNVGTTNTNLVVDQNKGFVRISVVGETVGYEEISGNPISSMIIDNGEIYVREQDRVVGKDYSGVIVSATSFSLKSDNSTNIIVDTDMSYAQFEALSTEDTYLWAVSQTAGSNLSNSYNSVRLLKRNNGSIEVVVEEGDFSDYAFYVNVYYIDDGVMKHDSVKINVVGVTYPTSYIFSFSRSNPRQFLFDTSMANDIFGGASVVDNQNNYLDCYLLTSRNQETEVTVNLGGTFTATTKSISYRLEDINNPSNNSGPGFINVEDLKQSNSELQTLGTDETLGYTLDSVSGMVAKVNGNPPVNRKTYKLTAQIRIGGRSAFNKSIILIVWNDADGIILRNTSNGLYNAVVSRYSTIYNVNSFSRDIYKSDLLVINGTINFEPYKNQTNSLLTENNDIVLTYAPYVTGMNLSGCSNLTGLLDLSDYDNIQVLDTSGTTLSVKFSQGSDISNLHLGSPYSVYIDRPTSLTSANVTVDNRINLTSIDIIKGDNQTCNAFNIFDNITRQYIYGGDIIHNKRITEEHSIVDYNDYNSTITSNINVQGGISINVISESAASKILEFDQNGQFIDYWGVSDSRDIQLSQNTAYIVYGRMSGQYLTYIKITDTTNNTILFKYES